MSERRLRIAPSAAPAARAASAAVPSIRASTLLATLVLSLPRAPGKMGVVPPLASSASAVALAKSLNSQEPYQRSWQRLAEEMKSWIGPSETRRSWDDGTLPPAPGALTAGLHGWPFGSVDAERGSGMTA